VVNRILAIGAVLLLTPLVGGCIGRGAPDSDGLKIGVAYDAGGLANDVNALTRKGILSAQARFGGRVGSIRELSAIVGEPVENRYDRLLILCQSGYSPVFVVGYAYSNPDPANSPLARAVRACPTTRFVSVDDAAVTGANVSSLVSADADGSYLVGVAAGLATKTGVVGFVGACQVPGFTAFEAGYRAGVVAGHPGAQVRAQYLITDPAQCASGMAAQSAAQSVAGQLYAGGADVVYQVCGGSAPGVFAAAKEHDALAIGAYSDQYKSAGPQLQGVILTSMLKMVDRQVDSVVSDAVAGRFTAGVRREDLRSGGVLWSSSGDLIRAMQLRLTTDKEKIIDGKITVPSGP
jgi:basic membrane protein A and related proteins